ncbi:MAG: hypothetical protein H2169_15165 [Opitutus sp.]|nr:hypothetical protein [Opitutus sp.]
MDTDEFVRNFKTEKERLLKSFLSTPPKTAVAATIQSMCLTTSQGELMEKVLDLALTDTFYTILLGLDGCCSIGDAMQQGYQIRAEDGSYISSGEGDIEGLAYHYFHESP